MTGKFESVLLAVVVACLAACGGDDKKGGNAAAGGGDGKKAPAAAPAGSGGTYEASKSTASVKVKVKWSGEKPKPVAKALDEFCTKAHEGKPVMDERYTVNDDGTLPHSFVWAKKGPHEGMSGFPAARPVTLDQRGCMYVPHVFGLRAGQNFTIKNSDGTKHNVHAHPNVNKETINDVQDPGASGEYKFSVKERAIPFNCDIHSWMTSTAFVLDHPFFGTTDASGAVDITGLPAGTYKFTVWHEGFTPAQKDGISLDVDVTVKDGEAVTKDVELK